MTRPLAVTFGEPAGIGPDITLAAWEKRDALHIPPFYIVADPEYLNRRARLLGLDLPISLVEPANAHRAFPDTLPVVDLGVPVDAPAGQPDDGSARAALTSLDMAIGDVLRGVACALVTNPIAKASAYRVGFAAPGHTEYLATVSARSERPVHPVMMLWSEDLAVVPVTIHVPLARVPDLLTTELIVTTGQIVARDLSNRFGIPSPRLAVCGLNPHAGENGSIGREEIDVIAPAITQLRESGLRVSGPFAADSVFHPAARRTYDAALAMYHDQALIPIKTIAFDTAVNTTLGLPFVRTSPDHGTAFDIAGSGRANPSSFVAALKLAARLAAADR